MPPLLLVGEYPENDRYKHLNRPDGCGDPGVPLPPAARRPGLGQLGLHPLGPGRRLVQQHRVECGAADPQAIHPRPGALRVEQAAGQLLTFSFIGPHCKVFYLYFV
jgi:hypothetical protein